MTQPAPGPSPAWVPAGFAHPRRVELPTGHHLRPIRAADVDLDFPAVMASQARLWKKYGRAWGWPPPMMTYAQDQADLARHEREIAAGDSFNYAVFDADETELLGCIYVDPPDEPGRYDVVVSWWVVDGCIGTPLETELARFVPQWVVTAWPFSAPLFSP